MVLIFFVAIKVDGYCKGEFIFDKENVRISFEGINEPENITIYIINSNGKEEINFKIDDFMHSFVELISFDTVDINQKEEMTDIMNNQYYYVKDVDLSKYYTKGNNIILIIYEIGNKTFKIRNDVFVDENYKYAKDEIKIK